VQVGDTLHVCCRPGEFVLAESGKPLVLISGGVGITPTLAMLDAALQGRRPVHFIHFARNRAAHAFRDAIDARQAKHAQLKRFYIYDEHTEDAGKPHAVGRLSTEQLAQYLPESRDVDAYFLGPKPFMRYIKKQLLDIGIPATQTRYEFFGPAGALD
jgi:nitric oxide dioxygenase